jgi:pimeloyl-ACP methyl ester carboxylesterase
LVRALVLVGCAPLRAADADGILPARLARLAPSERAEVAALRARLPAAPPAERDALLARWGALLARADAYDPLPGEEDHAGCDYAQHQAVWEEARARREAGDLLAAAGRVRCPVTVLHGAHDPHPAAPLRRDLAGAGVRLTFHLLARCGHEPWRERQARERFLALLEAAVA